MSSHCSRRPTPAYDYLLGVLSTITFPLVSARVLHAMDVITITNPTANGASSLAAAIFMSATFGLAWRRSVLHSRADRAKLTQRIDELENRVAETENSAWWGTPPVDADPERTVELGPNVHPIRHKESRQRGAS